MRICDTCGEKAVDEIILKADDTRVDICGGCRDKVLQALRPEREDELPSSKEHKRRGRPPKNLGQPN